jgi:hypothetical protein
MVLLLSSTRNFLRKHDVLFICSHIEYNARGIALYQVVGRGGVPITRVDNRTITRGFVATDLKKALGIDSRNSEVVVRPLDIKYASDLVEC